MLFINHPISVADRKRNIKGAARKPFHFRGGVSIQGGINALLVKGLPHPGMFLLLIELSKLRHGVAGCTESVFLEKNPCENIFIQAGFAGFDLKTSV